MFLHKYYQLSLSRDYVRHWGMKEAVRELIQNALDSESPFQYSITQEDDGTHTLKLISEFSSLDPRTLLLGSTSKSSSEEFIGSFGEGYKVAMLVLTREEYPMRILNNQKLWVPMFQMNKQFGESLLVVEETTLPYRNRGVTFEVSSLSQQDLEDIQSICLKMQKDVGQIKSTQYGDILLERPGKLYVGGLFICDTELKYGYDILPRYIKLERDRQTVSSFDLKYLVKDMWYYTREYDLIAEHIQDEVPDLQYAEYSSPDMVKEACYRLFRKNHPGSIVAKDQRQLNELVARGMERVVVVNSVLYSQVVQCPTYRQEAKVVTETVEERMKRWLSQHRGSMRTEAIVAFKELIKESQEWRKK